MKFRRSVSWFSVITNEIISWLFYNTIGRLNYFSRYSPDINIVGNSEFEIRKILEDNLLTTANAGKKLKFLDVGARDGIKANLAKDYEYQAIDIIPRTDDVLLGDICDCPQIPDNTYDVVFSMDVLEHVERPWDASKECIRITKPGGLIIHRTLFAYRYHPIPQDFWRFSSQGLEHLFTYTNEAETVLKGYDIRGRRKNHRGYNMLSKPPIDWLGGFRENWQVLWIGRIKRT